MISHFDENNLRKLRILVAPLDWGLGHATRCIPVIYELLRHDCEVWLAGEGAQEALLREEFPTLPFLELWGYRVRYARTSTGLFWRIMYQVPRIVQTIRREKEWLVAMHKKHDFDAVISDNRYGLSHEVLPSVFITHQLKIKTPLPWTEGWLQRLSNKHLDRFTSCWVPDREGATSLAGDLSHPVIKPRVPIQFTGPLSRFERLEVPEEPGHLLVILSGPEPQRSILENSILDRIAHYNGSATVVRGLPLGAKLIPSTNSIHFYNHLPTADLNREMSRAELVIARSGYSTVMDLERLGKKSILIPTPGQTEQEYLGRRMMEKGWALCIEQRQFSLDDALKQAGNFSFQFPSTTPGDRLSIVVGEFLRTLRRV
ncbi:MAG: glycosyl transferase family 28 [Chitinophagaceae bacterium]|nr:glycosyl transferase family 28 [Chitinophagaceae bacterium]